jgi:hypothetical protein
MTSHIPVSEKTPESASQTRQAPTATMHLPPLTNEQRRLLEAYRLGRLDEWRFQECLRDDPALSDYVRKLCRPSDPSARTH